MSQKLTFVNGAKAACGCRHEFSSGGGEYSDVAYVHLCGKHAGAPVLDDRWKARMLDGRAPERDEMGLGDHPELPLLDEGMMPRSFFAALGLELAHTSAEDQLDGDVLGAMSEAVNWSRWMPTAPKGDGWKLVSIFDTEDGPVAWWLRELPEAEDGTTTIRILQAEVEKLKARIARAGAAPAAVAPQGEEWRRPTTYLKRFGDAIALLCHGRRPEDQVLSSWLDGTSDVLQQFAVDNGPAWAQGIGLIDAATIAADQPTEGVAHEMRAAAAPALEAPAAPAGFDAWWERAGDGRSKMMAKQAWDAALAAAPQAPRMGEDALHLLRRLLSNQHTLTGPEFRAELEKIVAEESARHAAAPQAPATAIPDEFGTAEHWKEKAQYWAGVAHRLRQEALRGGPVDGIVQPTAPQAPAAPADGLAADVDALLTLLEEKEWAEHCTKTPLGQRLEAAITDMHKEIHAAEERCDVADTLLKRATELHEKGFMPWVEAEELALSEIGIEEAAIDELIREGTHRAVDEDFFLTGADEIRSFTRAVLVHQRMLHSWLSFTKAAPAAPAVDAETVKKAARYDWLRDFHNGPDGVQANLPHIAAGSDNDLVWALIGEDADAGIDAAIAAQAKEGGEAA